METSPDILELLPVRAGGYDYFLGADSMVRPGDLLSFNAMRFTHQIAAPVGPSGIARLGDIGNFVSLGKKRFSALADDGAVNITVAFADGESHRILKGYSPVTVSATDGQTSQPFRDPSSGLFRVRVALTAPRPSELRPRPRPTSVLSGPGSPNRRP